MAIRRSQKRINSSRMYRAKRERQDPRQVLRRMQLETLEPRQLLAVGPLLAGIQPNDGEVLRDGDIRHVAPRELTFQFQDGAAIDAATLDAIQVTRSGLDGEFSSAAAVSDLNTDGRVVFEFRAEALGQGGNGISIAFTQSDHGGADPPTVEVAGRTISVDLNTNFGNETRAGELVAALDAHSEARALVDARILRGSPNVRVGATPINFSPLILAGANAASAATDFGTSTELQVRFTAVQPGQDGNGIAVRIRSADLGTGQPPSVAVDEDGREIEIVLNSRAGSQSTVQDVVDAVNGDADVSAVITAAVEVGDRDLVLSNPPVEVALTLSGSSDVVIEPGALFLEDNGREVVLRFKENLPDDAYRVDIFGSGSVVLLDEEGNPFGEGSNFALAFDLDLGAQVVSVVPQPIVRDPVSGQLEQRRREIVVYFNDDDLTTASATDPDFYRLVFTSETVENIDDLEFTPLNVSYDRELDRAVLTFADELDRLPGPDGPVGAGTFRLRIGSSQPTPLPPLVTELSFDPGSSYDTAVNVGRGLEVRDGADGFSVGQVFTIRDGGAGRPLTTFVIAGDSTVAMQRAFTLAVPRIGGRQGGIGDGDTITIDDGTADVTFEFDRGSNWDTDHTRIVINGTESAEQVAQKIADAVENSGLAVSAAVLSGGQVHVGGTSSLTVVESGGLGLEQSEEIVPIAFDPDAVIDAEQMAVELAQAIDGAAFDTLATAQTDRPAAEHLNAAFQPTSRIALTGAAAVSLEVGFQGMRTAELTGLVIRSEIASSSFNLEFPGAADEPGHRDIPVQSHTTIPPDSNPGITTRFYNFQENYGVDDRNNPLTNAITENQKDRAREIFEFFGKYLGIQFVETSNLGYTIVTGDLRVIDPAAVTGPGGVLGLADPMMEMAVLDAGELDWDDTFGRTDVPGAESWFEVAMTQIATLLGYGSTGELPGLTITGSEPLLDRGNTPEAIYPGDHDIVHGQLLYRPDNVDIDLYRVDLPEAGRFTVETFAERQDSPSLLDSAVTVYRELRDVNGNVTGRQVVARNDDYYSEDSYLELRLDAGTYYVGVSASGNNIYDPVTPDSGLGGTSEGDYRLRLDFAPESRQTIVDRTGNALDGDNDGLAGGQYDYWFRSQTQDNTIYVDRSNEPALGQSAPDGTLGNPFNNIQTALALASARGVDADGIGAVVRIVGNEGADGLLATPEDALAYEIGFHRVTGRPLRDGSTLEVPRGVTVMVDSGAVIKLRRARIGVGSSSATVDRSGGSLQLLGTPRVIVEEAGTGEASLATDAAGRALPGSVYLTSIHDDEIGLDTYVDLNEPDAGAGNWGGVLLRNDIDRADRDRKDAEREGMFLNYVNHVDFHYGGGDVVILGQARPVSPVHMIDARPTVSFNRIQFSGDAAMSANPDSFEETNFHSAPFQTYATDSTLQSARFTSEYDRVGPDIHNNTLTANSLSGLFVRIATPAGGDLERMTVAGRFDDIDVVHILQENLIVAGTPGGPLRETGAPPVSLVTLTPLTGGTLAEETYNYRLAFVDAAGNEGPLSGITSPVDLASGQGSVRLRNLPPITAGFVARRLYRSIPGSSDTYVLAAELDPASSVFVDDGTTRGGRLRVFDESEQLSNLRARLDGRLAIDPGTIIKLDGSRIEAGVGAQLIAEGVDGNEVVLTSLQDDRYGFGGTFDTNNNGAGSVEATPGDWGGLYAGHLGTLSMDHAVVQYGGGVSRIEGISTGFNPVEVHQATARIAHTDFRFNANGTGGQAGPERIGRGTNGDGVVFVRGAQPILWANVLRDNEAAAININVNSLNSDLVGDMGRSTYPRTGQNGLVTAVDLVPASDDNQGPLVRGNRLGNNDLNGMHVRGGTLTTQGVWDDTDIVHVVLDETIVIPDFHTYGGLRLESSGTESLVVKLQGAEAGFEALGRPLDINDRIGGALQVIGTERHPVVITSLRDDTASAGLDVDGQPQGDTNNDAPKPGEEPGGTLPTGPEVDNGTLIDNDVPVDIPGHFEIRPGDGGSVDFSTGSGVTAQGNTQLFVNADWIFDFTNYIDVGSNGGGFDLGTSTVTMPATLIADDLVASEGTFTGANGPVNWRVETHLDDGVSVVYNTITLSSAQPLGDLQFINYLDEDVEFVSDDLLHLVGTPGQPDFRAFTLDDVERVGFSQSGFFEPGPELSNATYVGWAADSFANLRTAIQGPGTTYTVPGNINTANLMPFTDPALGDVFGLADVTTAFAWAVDPAATTATITSFLELIPRDPGSEGTRGAPGDWGELAIDEFAHDRNVDVTVEREPKDVLLGVDSNQDIGAAQYLGQLAPGEKSSDDNLRLGFEVHGLLNRPGDVDVYSFEARSGTEVWLDIDRTTHSLDSVVELLDGDGNVIALSDNSFQETESPSLLYRADEIPANHVNPLQKSVYQNKDYWSTNPRDAGMRVIVPGTPGQVNTYHVRVRSSNLAASDARDKLLDESELNGGLTAGQYQLQVRLRELDEVPGTTVQHSDIRFSTNGIHVTGGPVHSPLAGEVGEVSVANETLGTAQDMGNLLNTDRSTLGIAGSIGDGGTNGDDVDFYRFEVTYDSVATSGGHFPVVFDLDYAGANLGRANTVLSIFDSAGNLILSGADSNVAEDRPGPLQGTDLDDLSRGTVGALDPFVGTVELPVGEYFLAVSSNVRIPQELEQFLVPDPSNPLLRLEPIDSLARIAEDHLDNSGGSTAVAPQVPMLIEPSGIVPFHLGDVNLFVSRDTGGLNTSQVLTVNPFTGTTHTVVGGQNRDLGDIAMRQDGELYSFTLDLEGNTPTCFGGLESVCPATSDAEAGNFLRIDTGTGAATLLNDDGIETFNEDPANAGTAVVSNPVAGTRVGHGIHFQALTFANPGFPSINDPLSLYGIGSRPDGVVAPGVDAVENILYRFNRNTGVASSSPQADRGGNARFSGAGTQIVERGALLTGADPMDPDGSVLVAVEATRVDPVNGTQVIIDDGMIFTIDHDGFAGTPGITFEFNSGPEVFFDHDPANGVFVIDGDTFTLSSRVFEFNTGSVVVVNGANGAQFNDGDLLTITDDNNVTRSFEFDRDNNFDGNNERIGFTFAMNQAAIVQQVVDAINAAANFNVTAEVPAGSNRISLRNDSLFTSVTFQTMGPNGPGIAIEGDSMAIGTPIPVEETFSRDEFASAILTTFNGSAGPPATPGVPGVTASVDGRRLNFSGAQDGDFSSISNPNVFTSRMTDGLVASGSLPIDFLAADTPSDIARRITEALNNFSPTSPDTQTITATQDRNLVNLAPPSVAITPNTSPILIAGAAPGGMITGATFLGTRMFAVTDTGGLFEILNYDTNFAMADYIESSAADLRGIDFQGLTAGPAGVENGAYANTLFAISGSGRLFAFDTTGELQPVFLDGATSIQTSVSGAHGLAFSTSTENLWQVGDFGRENDPGHGLNPTFDGSRPAGTPGGASLHFGRGAGSTYDVPGGAHGVVESAPFSLAPYASADEPVLYFNYLLDTENANADLLNPDVMRDAFRVYVVTEDGTAHLVATNNSDRGPFDDDDEFDDPDPNDAIDADVQELFDVGDNGAPASWRQARIPLGTFAGLDNLRLRFDFNTSGDYNLGDPSTVGEELRAIDGSRLRDGDAFEIDGIRFEFDLGYTLIAPTGAALNDGDTFRIGSATFEFNSVGDVFGINIAVPFSPDESAASIAATMEAVIQANFVQEVTTVNLTERNDTLQMATESGLNGGFQTLTATSRIGDNPNLVTAVNQGRDVDLLSMELNARDRLMIRVDSADSPQLDTIIRLFDSAGNELAFNDDGTPPDGSVVDSYLDFTVPSTGTYYLGISGFGNATYDPTVEASGTSNVVGSFPGNTTYSLRIDVSNEAGITRRDGNRLALPDATEVAVDAAALILEGAPGASGVALAVHPGMSEVEVAQAVRQSLADVFAGGNADAIKTNREVVKVIGHTVTDQGPLGLTSFLYGDLFGDFNSNRRGQDNAHEGVYVDDLIIGFAERGEMATGAVADSSFAPNPLASPTEIVVGPYQVEVRRGAGFGTTVDAMLQLDRAFDTNDRLAQQHTLIAPRADEIAHNQTFTLSDGVNALTFQYIDVNIGGGAEPGQVPILFDPSVNGSTPDSAFVIAQRIRDAINTPAVRSILDITAASSDGAVTGPTGSHRVNLFGNVVTQLEAPALVISDTSQDANVLRDGLLGGSTDVLPVGDAFFDGSDVSAGFFAGGRTSIGIASGIVLSTGSVFSAEGPNRSDFSSGLAAEVGDQDLDAEFGLFTTDRTVLEFTVNLPSGGDLEFDYVFASEEYNESVNSEFNDVFAFFIEGPGLPMENLATLPDGLTPISVNTVNGGGPVLGDDPSNAEFYVNNDPSDDGPLLNRFGHDGFTRPLTARKTGLAPGQYTIKLAISDVSSELLANQLGDSAVFIQPLQVTPPGPVDRIEGIRFDDLGDQNHHRDQGQLILKNNRVSNMSGVGILVEPGSRDISNLTPLAGDLPHPGPVRNLRELNNEMLLPGVTVTNNLIIGPGEVGIRFAGEPTPADGHAGPVPFGRIINNTVVDGSGAVGIQVADNASPTLLNNVLAGLGLGLEIDLSSNTTVVSGTLYSENAMDSDTGTIGAGDFPLFVADMTTLFVDPAEQNYYPAAGSRLIDSGVDSMQDRAALVTVKNPLGIAPSPVLSPEYDALGQERIDDRSVDPPDGQGANVFVDRGAIERADFAGPSAQLINPRDNDASGNDLNGLETFVEINAILDRFSIQLVDGVAPNDAENGSGIDDSTVNANTVSVFRDGVELILGEDYRFGYDQVANVIHLTPLAGIWEPNREYKILLANDDSLRILTPDVETVADGDQFDLTDTAGNTELFEFESGYSLQVPATFQLQVPEGGGTAIGDSDTFSVSDGATSVIFEFDRNNVVGMNTTVIDYTLGDTPETIAAAIIAALEDADLQLEPVGLGGGLIHLGSQSFHSVDVTGSTLTLAGVAGGVADGDTLLIDDGLTSRVIFEFDEDGRLNDASNQAIDFQFANTHEEIAERIVSAVQTASLGLTPRHLGDGLVQLGGTFLHLVDASGSNLMQFGQGGVQPAFGLRIPTIAGVPDGVMDMETFTIDDGTGSTQFELTTDQNAMTGNKPIFFEEDASTDEIAAAIVTAIEEADIGLEPVHLGGGVIALGGDASYSLGLTNTSLTQVGLPGEPAATAVEFIPSAEVFTTEDLAEAIVEAINMSQILEDVAATADGVEVEVFGITAVNGLESIPVTGIADLAGNSIQANRVDGETAFTVVVGQGLDYGDAPDPSFPTLASSGGARHQIVPGFTLGDLIDSEFDGQPTSDASGDGPSDDGIRFTRPVYPGYETTLRITANGIGSGRAGFLDAWIDFNNDGLWDASEQVADSLPLNNGVTFFDFEVPNTATVADVVGRFRLSSTGDLEMDGFAEDGEVEDYLVSVENNPWQNPRNQYDVNDDGKVTPIDVLILVNRLNTLGSGPLDPALADPPPYLDVNGDGFVAPSDANDVVTFINGRVGNNSGGEGEASGFGPLASLVSSLETDAAAWELPGAAPGLAAFADAAGLSAAGREVSLRLAPRLSEAQLQRIDEQLQQHAAGQVTRQAADLVAAELAASDPAASGSAMNDPAADWNPEDDGARFADALALDLESGDDTAHDAFFADF